jgi:outer membrane protein OmpA-like peptidoglycan-associated protein
LQDGSLYGEPSDTVEYLTDSGYLGTDLTGVTVVLTQTGAVAQGAAQPVLDSSALKRLDRLWSAVFSAASATVTHANVEFELAVGPFPHNEIVPVASVTPHPAGCRLPMTGAQLNFLPDSAAFVDAAASAGVIAAAAEQLKAAGCSGEVVLIGTTSSAGNAAGRERLSYDRADGVRTPLAHALSLTTDEIEIVAAGYDERYCAHDRDVNNRLIPGLASACRQVIITIGSSDWAKETS